MVGWTRRRRAFDEPLLGRSLENPAAFHDFYRAYVDRIVVFFARRTFDPEISLDLTAETFALALERRGQFRGSTWQEEAGWLFAIARSQLQHHWRRGEVERAALARIGVDPPYATAADLEWVERRADLPRLRMTVRGALGALPDDLAVAVVGRVVEERPYADIAGELDVSEQVVRARVSRGLRAMAETLGDPVREHLA